MAPARLHVLTACLAGAGLVAAVQGGLELPLPGHALGRLLAALCILGAWIPAGILGLLLAAGRAPAGLAFWLGAALALPPATASLLPAGAGRLAWLAAALLPALALAAAAPRLGRRLRPPAALTAAVTLLLLLFLLANPFWPAGAVLAEPPPWRPAPNDGRPLPDGPDVLLISVDTLRADAVAGPDAAPVPHLDALRSEGTWAAHALSSSNQTLPGHVGMLSGLDAPAHGVRSNVDVPDPRLHLLAERFHEAGWSTAGIVSNGLISSWLGMDRGFEVFDDTLVSWSMLARAVEDAVDRHSWLGVLPPRWRLRLVALSQARAVQERKARARERVLGERVLARALGRVDELSAGDRPWFLFVHFMDVHAPYLAGPGFRGRLTGGEPRPPAPWLPQDPDIPWVDQQWLLRIEQGLQEGDPGALEAAAWLHRFYLESVSWVDDCIGRIVARARASGRPLVVLVTGDHGEQFGEHELMEHANSLFEENLRVPFLLWGAGVPPGELEVAAHLQDVAPTLLDLAGIEAPDLAGRSLVRVAPPRPHVSGDDRWLAVQAGPWKWIGERQPDGGPPKPIGLYRLDRDPAEADNLLGREQPPPEILAALDDAQRRDTWKAPADGPSAAQQAALQALGYVNGGEEKP